MIEFISYDGKYPCYCAGVLTLKIDGVVVSFPPHTLESGGGTNWRDDEVWSGPWTVWDYHIPSEYKHLKKIIEKVVNENVPFGCCGGCI